MPAAMQFSKTDLSTPERRDRYTVGIIECERLGLATACLFAEAGFRIICVDTAQRLMQFAERHRVPYCEPKFDKLVKKHLKTNRITIATSTREAASASDIIIFTIPASIDQNGDPDYSYVEKICKEAGMGLREGCLIIFQTTVGPGITETVVKETIENASGLKAGIDFGLAYSPVRANPRGALQDIAMNPRIVGAINEQSLKGATLVLRTITKGDIVNVTNMKTAEAVNMFEHAYTNVSVALANEFAQFCEKNGIDFIETYKAANTYSCCHLTLPQISNKHISKTSAFLLEEAEATKAKLRVVKLSKKVNDEMLTHTVRLVKEALRSCGRTMRRARILVLGASSHPNMKEHRGSSSRKLVGMLKRRGASVQVYDPFFSPKELKQMRYPAERTLTKSVEGVDCLLITVRHDRFKRLNLRRIKFLARKPTAIVDMARVIDPSKAEKEGFVYRGIGKGIHNR